MARALADLERVLTNELTAEIERLPLAGAREPTLATGSGPTAERPLVRVANGC